MRQDVELTAFTKGELSPRLKGRTDFKGYFDGCETVLNMVVMPQGGLTRRPGTLYSANVKTQSRKPHLARFLFGNTTVVQAYMLEFGHDYIRVYKDRSPVENDLVVTGAVDNGGGLIRLTVASTAGLQDGNTATVAAVGGVPGATGTWPIDVITATTFDLVGSSFAGLYTTGGTASVLVEIVTTYTETELPQLGFTQSADTLYITHPSHAPAKLTRSSHTHWTLSDLTILDGPYLTKPGSGTTLTASAATGSVSLTLSSTLGVNNGSGFVAGDVNRQVRSFGDGSYGWATISGVLSSVQVVGTVREAVANGALDVFPLGPVDTFYMGKWSTTTGFPWLSAFYQQRLFMVGTNNEPNAVEGSNSSDYVNYAPTTFDGTVLDSNAVDWIVNDEEVNAVRWLSGAGSAQTPQLGIGTSGSEQVLQAGGTAQALTPTSVQVYRETKLGAVPYCPAIRINKAVLFAQVSGRKLYEWTFNWQVNGYEGRDLTVESEHITRGLIADITYQKAPLGVVWVQLENGGLAGFTYLTEQKVEAWHHHQLGGDYYGGPPVVESIECIPSSDGTYDELWLAVKRTINGSVVRTVEVMEKFFDAGLQEDALFMDCAARSDLVSPAATLTPSAFTGDAVYFNTTAGAPFASTDVGSIIRCSGGVAQVTEFVGANQVIGVWWRDASSTEPQTSGTWTMTPQASTFSGLDYLEGQTVQILGDGADFGTETVTAGAVTLDTSRGKASLAAIGLPMESKGVTMPWATQQSPSGQGRIKTIATLYLRLLESLGCNIGRKVTDPMTQEVEEKVEPLEVRSAGDDLGFPSPLFTGLYRLPLQGSHDMEGQILWETSGPFPLTVLALVATGDVGEMPGGRE